MSQKRDNVKAEIDLRFDKEGSSSPCPTKEVKEECRPHESPKNKESWSARRRLELFEAYQACSQVKWDEVAKTMGGGITGKQCREQWQRSTGKQIRKALGEDRE